MAVTITNVLVESSNSDTDNYTTGSFSLQRYRLGLLTIATYGGASAPEPSTVTTAGITWTKINTQVGELGTRRITLYRTLNSNPVTGTVNFTLSTAQTRALWVIDEVSYIDWTGTNGANAIVQSAINTNALAASLTVTLAAFGSTDNATYGSVSHNGTGTISPGSGFSELAETGVTAENSVIETEWKATNDTSVDWSWTGNQVVVGIAVELKFNPVIPAPNQGNPIFFNNSFGLG